MKNHTQQTQRGRLPLPDQARLMPTPRASDTETVERRAQADFRPPLSQHVLPLVDPETLLPTPRATKSTKGCLAQAGFKGNLMLPSAIIHLLDPAEQGRHLIALKDPHDSGSLVPTTSDRDVNWGIYSAAIHRWEHVLGRRAPCPTQPGRHGRLVLSPAFVEYLMGLPPGWVTDLPLPRTAQLQALGNGVVPQQATSAVSLLLADLATLTAERPESDQETNAA